MFENLNDFDPQNNGSEPKLFEGFQNFPTVRIDGLVEYAISKLNNPKTQNNGLGFTIGNNPAFIKFYRNPDNRNPYKLKEDSGRHILCAVQTRDGFNFVYIFHSGRGVKHGSVGQYNSENIVVVLCATHNNNTKNTKGSCFVCPPSWNNATKINQLFNSFIQNPTNTNGGLRVDKSIINDFGYGAIPKIPDVIIDSLQNAIAMPVTE